jgi:hypothetical protein
MNVVQCKMLRIYAAFRIDKLAKNEIVQDGITEASKTVTEKDLISYAQYCYCFRTLFR